MKEIIEKINNAKSVAVLGHVNADPDSIGSCFAFAHMMRLSGKEAVVYLSEKIEDRLTFMGDDYVVYEGENPPHHDLCVCLDCGDIDRLGLRKDIFDAADNTVSIDHHRTNTYFAQANYVDGEAPAAAELLCRLFREMHTELDCEAAKQLYTALSSDTGCFKFSSVTPQTMREAADLLEYGFDHAEIARQLFDSNSPEEIRFKAEAMLALKRYFDGKLTLVIIDDDMVKRSGLSEDKLPNIVEIPRCVQGTEIAVSLKERKGDIRVNLRSNGAADVSAIALRFGGGGHIKAAGCTIKETNLEEAEKLIIEVCREVLC
ncbi:MAG: bifunctional oligoribonuclease/PAP phosphatase NrnA [bacterium]|nr:bifunctional oligoribonuclease/PAP phosphatase NrnA [bacterium]